MTGASRAELRVQVPQVARALPEVTGAADLDVVARQEGRDWQVEARGSAPGAATLALDAVLRDAGTDAAVAEGQLRAEVGQIGTYAGLTGTEFAGAAEVSGKGRFELATQAFDVTASGATKGLSLAAPSLQPLVGGRLRFDLAASGRQGTIDIEKLALSGPGLAGNLRGMLGAEGESLRFDLTVPQLERIVPQLAGQARLEGTARRAGARYILDVSGRGPGGITLDGGGTVATDGQSADLGFEGAAPLALANAQLGGAVLTGLARYDVQLSGPIAPGSVSGRIAVSDATAFLPRFDVRLEEAGGTVSVQGGRAQLALSGAFETGGRVSVDGPITLAGGFPADLAVRLDNAVLRDGRLYEARLGGLVTARGPLTGGAVIGGRIDIRELELRLPRIGPSYSALGGLRHVAPGAGVRRTLRYSGLTAENDGALRIAGRFPARSDHRGPGACLRTGPGARRELGGQLRLGGHDARCAPRGTVRPDPRTARPSGATGST